MDSALDDELPAQGAGRVLVTLNAYIIVRRTAIRPSGVLAGAAARLSYAPASNGGVQ